jgi:hypothetical protein
VTGGCQGEVVRRTFARPHEHGAAPHLGENTLSKVKNQPRKQKTSPAAGHPAQQNDKAAMSDAKASVPAGGQDMPAMSMPDAQMRGSQSTHAMRTAHKKEKRFGHN